MGKVVKPLVTIVAVGALAVFAAPIAGAVAAGLGGIGISVTAAAISTALVSTAVGMALTMGVALVSSIFRKPPQLSQSLADRLGQSVNPAAPRKFVFGRTFAGNDVRYQETYGSKEDRHVQVIALASHKLSAIREWYVEEKLTWNGALTGEHAGGFNSFAAITEGSAANARSLGSGVYWTNAAKFTGCAYLAIDYKLDEKKWPNNLPSKTVTIVDGCPVYDPRRDSTNGGSGSHRPYDQSTWRFDEGATQIGRNPALCLLTYLIGWRINGKLAWGMGVPVHRINLDNFRIYANVCEERVALQAGGTVQRYTCDGTFSTAESHETVISAISASMGSCKFTDVGGSYGLVGGYDDTMGPRVSLSEDDLIALDDGASPYAWAPAGSVRDTFNIVRGKYADPSPGVLGQLVEWGEVVTAPLADGVDRPYVLDLGCVSRAETCQRIAKQFLLREAKTPGVFSGTFGPNAFQAQVGSLVELSIRSQGWNRKLFRVLEQAEAHDLIFQMTLREESPEVYAWDKEEKPLPTVIRPTGYDPKMKIPVQGLALSTETYISN